jgi:hypothetical protein
MELEFGRLQGGQLLFLLFDMNLAERLRTSVAIKTHLQGPIRMVLLGGQGKGGLPSGWLVHGRHIRFQ